MPATSPTPTDRPHLRVLGHSQVRVPADLAELLVTVTGTGASPARATTALRRAHQRLTRVLTRFDATVTSTHTSPATLTAAPAPEPAAVPGEGPGEGPADVAWVATAEVSVHIGDVTGLAALHGALVKLAGARVSGPTWALRSDHAAYGAVRRDAVRDAHQRARVLAEAAGSTLEGLDWLREDAATPTPSAPAGPADVLATLGLEPAQHTVAVTVHAQYRIAPIAFPRTNEGRAHS